MRISRLVAALLEAEETGVVYSVDDDGKITPLSLVAFEELPENSPLLRRVMMTRAMARLASLKLRGLPALPAEVARLRN